MLSRPKRIVEASAKATDAEQELRELLEEYQEWRDNLPENLDQSPVAEKLDETIDILERACDSIEEAYGEIDSLDLPQGFGRD